jgi:hypothetical protein
MCYINTTDFDIQIHYLSQFVVHVSYFVVRMSYFVVRVSYFVVRVSYFVVRMSYFQRNIKLDLTLYCNLKMAVI